MTTVYSGWGTMLLIVTAVTAMIVLIPAFYHSRRPWRFLAGVVVGLMALAVVAFGVGLTLASQRARFTRELSQATAPSPAPEAEAPATPSPAWLDADEYFLDADVYPSAAAATRGLAAELVGRLHEVTEDHATPSKIFVKYQSHTEKEGEAAMQTLRRLLPSAQLIRDIWDQTSFGTIATSVRRPGNLEYPVEINLVMVPEAQGGHMQANLFGQGGRVTRVAKYLDKPWVENFSESVSSSPMHPWVLAQSFSPALDVFEAESQARRDAEAKLLPLIRRGVEDRLPGRWVVANRSTIDARLGGMIESALQDPAGGLVADKFVQRFHRPGGDVYRALLLIDADPAKLSALENIFVETHARQQTRRLSLAGSLLVLLAVVTGLYLFLNAATKGYYVAAIRCAMAALAILGIVALKMIA